MLPFELLNKIVCVILNNVTLRLLPGNDSRNNEKYTADSLLVNIRIERTSQLYQGKLYDFVVEFMLQ